MDKNWSIGVTIGAALGNGFNRAIGSARDQFNSLGSSLKGMTKLQDQFVAVEKTRQALSKAQQEVMRLKQALRADPGNAGLAKELEKAQGTAEKLSGSLDRQRKALRASEQEMRKAGVEVGNSANGYNKLGDAIDKTRAKHEKLGAALARKKAAESRMSDMRGEMVGMAGAAYGAARLVGHAMDFEHEMRLFGNIADLSNDQLATIRMQLKEIGAATNQDPGQLLAALTTLTAKGLDPGRAVASLSILGKTATASGADINDLATTVYSLIDAMNLSPDDLPRAMDMLAQAGKAGSFELKDMAQYFPMLTAQAKSLNLVGMEGIATLGSALQVAMKGASDPSVAANNFQNFLAKLASPETIKKFETFGVNIEEVMKNAAAAGKNPIEEALKTIQELTGGDKFRIGELFGDMQVINFLNPMLQNMEEFKRIKSEALAAKGTVDKDFGQMSETSKEQLKAFTVVVGRLGDAFATGLLPAVNAVLQPVASVIGWAVKMVEKYPLVGAVITGAVGALLAWRLAVLGITAAQWLWNASMAASPVGMIVVAIGALVAAGVWLYGAWKPFADLVDMIWSGIKAVGSFVGSAFGSSDGTEVGATQAARARADAAGTNAATFPHVQPASRGSVDNSQTVNAPITIHATPGMNAADVANAVDRKLRERESQAAARSRGALHD